MSSSKGQGRRGPTTRSMSHVSAGGKVTKLPTSSRAPASPAPKATTSSSQSRPGSSSQQSAKSIPVSQTAESSINSDAGKNIKKAARDLLVKLEGMQKIVRTGLEGYKNREYRDRQLRNQASAVASLKDSLNTLEKRFDNIAVNEIINGPKRFESRETIACSTLALRITLTNSEETQKAITINKMLTFVAAATYDMINVRIEVYQDLFTLIDRLINCTNWLTELLEGKIQPPKETFSAQNYWVGIEKITSNLKGLFSARMYLETKIMEEKGIMGNSFRGTTPDNWLRTSNELITMIGTKHKWETINQLLLDATSKNRVGMSMNAQNAMMKIVPEILQKDPPKYLPVHKIPID